MHRKILYDLSDGESSHASVFARDVPLHRAIRFRSIDHHQLDVYGEQPS